EPDSPPSRRVRGEPVPVPSMLSSALQFFHRPLVTHGRPVGPAAALFTLYSDACRARARPDSSRLSKGTAGSTPQGLESAIRRAHSAHSGGPRSRLSPGKGPGRQGPADEAKNAPQEGGLSLPFTLRSMLPAGASAPAGSCGITRTPEPGRQSGDGQRR